MPKFRVAAICTGNICRSPLGEALLRRDLTSDLFAISSAGIMAATGALVPRQQIRIAEQLGVEGLQEHQPRLVDEEYVSGQNLILAMSRGHRKRLMQRDPGGTRRTFTIREFARLAPLVTPDDVEEAVAGGLAPLSAAVEAVARKRGLLPPPQFAEELDVIDPYRQSASVYRLARDELVPAARTTADYLTAVVGLYGVEPAVRKPELAGVGAAGRAAGLAQFPSRADRTRRAMIQRASSAPFSIPTIKSAGMGR